MLKLKEKHDVVAALVACATAAAASAQVVIETLAVGNVGNAADTRYESPGYGRVGYIYRIGKYEVTTGQYTAFLNAVAATDSYGLYSTEMWWHNLGCKIQRSGAPGSYSYSVASDWVNRPVNYVSWGDAARFANWLHNGQPTGSQNLSTTEDGAYYLNGATTDDQLMDVSRRAGWRWAITSEDEWYKAAYHKNDGPSGNYWDYPMGSSAEPNNGNPGGDTGNSANFYWADYAIGSPYYRTDVGYFGISDGPYGTFDQAGNAWEWTEGILSGSSRCLRGGSFGASAYFLRASGREGDEPAGENFENGFRVSQIAGCLGDLTGDLEVTISDLAQLLSNFGTASGASPNDGDSDNDGDVDLQDLATLLANFGTTC